jgi:hypothetical protein
MRSRHGIDFRRAAALFPAGVAVFVLIGVASLTVAGRTGRAVPAPKNRHDRQE